jgi:hypothetical protein
MSSEEWLVWVNRAYFGFGGVAALATAVVVIAGIAQNQLNGTISARKDIEFSEFRLASEARTAELQRLTAEANKATEQERIARLEMQAKFAWRTIPPDIAGKIRDALPPSPGLVKLAYIANDPESLFLANQIAAILKAANWEFYPEAETYYQRLFFDIIVPGPDSAAISGLRRAFNDSGVPVTTIDVPVADFYFGAQGLPAPIATILVGSKAPPF